MSWDEESQACRSNVAARTAGPARVLRVHISLNVGHELSLPYLSISQRFVCTKNGCVTLPEEPALSDAVSTLAWDCAGDDP